MEFGPLGPLEVRADERVLDLSGPKPRALVATLLVHANEVVSAERPAMALPTGSISWSRTAIARCDPARP